MNNDNPKNLTVAGQPIPANITSTSYVENNWELIAQQLAHIDPQMLAVFICLILALLPSACDKLTELIKSLKGK